MLNISKYKAASWDKNLAVPPLHIASSLFKIGHPVIFMVFGKSNYNIYGSVRRRYGSQAYELIVCINSFSARPEKVFRLAEKNVSQALRLGKAHIHAENFIEKKTTGDAASVASLLMCRSQRFFFCRSFSHAKAEPHPHRLRYASVSPEELKKSDSYAVYRVYRRKGQEVRTVCVTCFF